MTYLSALPVQGYKSMAAITAADPQIAHFQLCRFGDTCPSAMHLSVEVVPVQAAMFDGA